MRLNIGKKVLLSLLFVAIIAVAVSSFISIVQSQKALKEATLRGFENVAAELFYAIRSSVQEGIDSVQIVANDSVIRSTKSWTWQKEEKLKQLKTIIKAYEDITLISPNGNVITSTDYNFRGSWKHKAHFKKALSGESCASNVRLIPNPIKLVISFAAPVFDETNNVIAVVAMQLNLDNIQRIVRHIKIGETGHAVLVDEYGRHLVHSDNKKLLEKINLQVEQQLASGDKHLIYQSSKGNTFLANYFSTNKLRKTETASDDEPNWTVVIAQSQEEVYKELEGIRYRLTIAAGITFIVIVIIALLVSKTITDPIRILQKGADIIRNGNLSHQVKISSRDEIGDLASSFNSMAKELLIYQTELESKVEERTAALSTRNRDMRMVMENVNQGFITVYKNGVMSPEHSAIVDTWFEKYEEGIAFRDFLAKSDETFAEWFELAWEDLQEDIMPMEVIVDQMPMMLVTDNRHLQFSYSPILDEKEKVSGLLVVIADVTERLRYEEKELEQREILQVFKRVNNDKTGYLAFQKDAQKLVNNICSPTATDNLVLLKRQIHTLKGNCGLFGLGSISEICHQVEDEMVESPGSPVAERLNQIKLAFETVLANTKIFTSSSENTLDIAVRDYEKLIDALEKSVPSDQILHMLKNWLLEPVSRQFERIEEQAKSLAARLGKGDITVTKQDNDIRLESEQWSEFWSSMSHIIRNAIDHGLPDASESKKQGTLTLASIKEQERLTITIGDNGRGIDWSKVQEKAVRMGLPHATMDEQIAVIFSDGFSTKDAASKTSGRGVGLSAVKQVVTELNGQVFVESELRKGTTWRFVFPTSV